MKATDDCRYCLEGLLRQAVELATGEPDLRAKVIDEGLLFLDREFSTEKTSIAVATPLHRLVRNLTGNSDPYSRVKEADVAMAAEIIRSLDKNPGGDLRECLVYAVRGNSIDFFKDRQEIMESMAGPVEFVIDDTAKLENRLKDARCILYLADNAGEEPFDLPLLRLLGSYAPITYVVKESPVQDDLTLADLEKFAMIQELPRVISTGTDTPGVDMDIASVEFKEEFAGADIVLAKGMGYWETLSELPRQGNVFHLLKAKCRPVADSIGVPLNGYVALLR